jgi:hypothetical protein
MNNFKKVFNQAKLNAPKFEEPVSSISKSHSNMSLSSSSLNASSANSTKSKSMPSSAEKVNKTAKKNTQQSPPPSPKSPKRIDYSKFEPLNGAPRANDKLAFQVILQNFYFIFI